MAAGGFTLYTDAIDGAIVGPPSWANDNHYVVLLGASYTPSAAHTTFADISAHEITAPGYLARDLTGEAVAFNGSAIALDANAVSFGNPVDITAKYAVVLVGTAAGKAAGNVLVGYLDLNTASTSATVSSVNGAFTVDWAAAGLISLFAFATGWYTTGLAVSVANGNWASDSVCVLLCGTGYTPNIAHSTIADVVANELSGGNYARLDLTGKAIVDGGDFVYLDAANLSWGATATTITGARYLVVAQSTAAASTNSTSLLFYIDLGTTYSSSNGEFSITLDANGISYLRVF